MSRSREGRIALRVALSLVAMDCDEFRKQYLQLVKQYHMTTGPAKRQLFKTIEIMERRLREECPEEEEEQDKGITFVTGSDMNPDKMWRSKEPGTAFMYFVKSGLLVEEFGYVTHDELLDSQIRKIKPKDIPHTAEMLKTLLQQKMSWKQRKEWDGTFGQGGNKTSVKELARDKKMLRAMFAKVLKEDPGQMAAAFVVLGDPKEIVVGRTALGEMTTWGKPSKSVLKKIAKMLTDEEVHKVHV